MSRTLRKELIREIRGSRSRFFSIFVMVALGVLFLVGLRSAAPDMRDTSDRFFDENGLYDVQILSTLGLTEEDVTAFSQVEGVEQAEGGWSIDATLALGDVQKVVKAISLSQAGFQEPTVLEGRLPQGKHECAVDAKLLEAMEVSVGDTVTLTPGETMTEALEDGSYTITGVVESPLYISLDRGTSTLGDGRVVAFVLLPEESFRLDYYTMVNIRAAGAKALDAYGTDYQDLIGDLTERLEVSAQERGDLRYTALVSDAQSQVDEAQQELDDAKAQADEQIQEGRQELADARTQLDEGWEELAESKDAYEEGVASGQAQLADARTQLDEGWEELSDSKDTLNSAQGELDSQRASAQSQLSAAWQELNTQEENWNDAKAQVDQAQDQVTALEGEVEAYRKALEEQQQRVEDMEQMGIPVDPDTLVFNQETLDAMEAQLAGAKAQLAASQAQLDQGRQQLDAGWAEYYSQVDAAEQQLAAAQAQIDSGWSQYYAGQEELESGETAYADALSQYDQQVADAAQQIADGETELQDGETEYSQGLQELEDAETQAEEQLSQGQSQIQDAQDEIREIKPAEVYVLDRESNYGFVSYDQHAARMENLARMFPLIFFVVAALVCLTTMTRMVEEERTQIGTIKAMGYGTGAIAAKFLIYGAVAALLGALVGGLIGTTLIPWVIFTSYGVMYTLPKLELTVHWGLCFAALGAGLICTVGATLWAMLSTAQSSPASLMRPKAPKAGKRILLERIPLLWKHFTFSMKVSARNLFRYKKRFWMTVIGVAGCTALLIAGLGLRSSIFSIIDLQYGGIYQYSAQVGLDTSVDHAREDVGQLLSEMDSVSSMAPMNTRSVEFQGGDTTVEGYLTVTDDPASLYQQIDLHDMNTGAHLDIPEDGVIIDEKLAEMLGLKVGDSLTIDCGQRITVKVAGINEHYVYHYAYMTAAQYEALTGEPYEANEYLITTVDPSDEGVSQVCQTLMEQKGVRSAVNMGATSRSFRSTLEVVDAAVMIIIISAAALALVVLYNLTNINITERIRELATIKVLGFYDMEVAMYVYRENIVLTVLGIALGQVLGKYLCTYLVSTVEMDIVMFGRQALPQNYIVSVLMSVGFAVLVNVLMYFRMKKIDMVESLKSVE